LSQFFVLDLGPNSYFWQWVQAEAAPWSGNPVKKDSRKIERLQHMSGGMKINGCFPDLCCRRVQGIHQKMI